MVWCPIALNAYASLAIIAKANTTAIIFFIVCSSSYYLKIRLRMYAKR